MLFNISSTFYFSFVLFLLLFSSLLVSSLFVLFWISPDSVVHSRRLNNEHFSSFNSHLFIDETNVIESIGFHFLFWFLLFISTVTLISLSMNNAYHQISTLSSGSFVKKREGEREHLSFIEDYFNQNQLSMIFMKKMTKMKKRGWERERNSTIM